MTISQYISQLNKYYKTGISVEHTYRGELADLIQALSPGYGNKRAQANRMRGT